MFCDVSSVYLSTNETVQVFVDDLSKLGDEETLGNTSDNAIKEYSSPFTDIDYRFRTLRCSVLQCVAVCCSVLQCVAVCCSTDIDYRFLVTSLLMQQDSFEGFL